MKVTLKGTKLTIELDVVKKPSKSGKSVVIATTNGNQPSTLEVDGKPLIVGVNAYISAS